MAASSLNVARVRLYFDYPPPAVSTCRMCWLLIDLNKCRVVADLVSVIREKFDYSRKTCLDLFIEDCYLPPSESIYVVRDNDIIRVKAESQLDQNGSESSSKSSKVTKRRRETEEQEGQDEQSKASALKKRKATEESQATQLCLPENSKKKKKGKKRKRKEEHASVRQTETAKQTPAASVTKPHPEKSPRRQKPSTFACNGKPVARKPQGSSSDSSDSSDEELPKTPAQQPKSQRKLSSSVGPTNKPGSAAKHKDGSSSSDSDTDSDSVQPPPKKPTPAKSVPAKPKPSPANAAVHTKTKPLSKKQVQSSSSDSDTDSSTSVERPPPKRTPVRIPPPASSSNPKASASASATAATGSSKKPAAKTAETSSDSDSSSSSERPPVRKPPAASAPNTPSSGQTSAPPGALGAEPAVTKPAITASESDSSEEEIELVIRKPVLNGMGLRVAGVVSSSPVVGAGRGRGDARSPVKGFGRGEGRFARRGSGSRGGGRGNGTPWNKGFRYDYSDEEQKRNRRFNDSLTNTSLILQNPPEPAPPRDYTVFPLLAAPPAVGQKIAFKLLELTENYSPEVSDYKEGKITGFNATTNTVDLHLLSTPKVPMEPGKFDLVYENADGSEVVEYAVIQGTQLTEQWDSLLEPRLIVESVG